MEHFHIVGPEGDPDRVVADRVRTLEAIHRPLVVTLNSDELLALLESDALRDLDAAKLSAASAQWRATWRIVLDRHDSMYELEDEALRALARLPQTRLVVSTAIPVDALTPAMSLATIDDRAFQAAQRDDALIELAAVKVYHLRVLRLLYGRLRTEAESVLAQIRTELHR